MKQNLKMWIAAGLSAVAGTGMAVIVGSAGADVPAGNVISNPNAETPRTGTGATELVAPPWERLTQDTSGTTVPGGGFSQGDYTLLFPAASNPGPAIGGGNRLFAGGFRPSSGTNFARQSVSLAGTAPEIDAGRVTATLAAHLGARDISTNTMKVDAEFRDGAGAALSTLTVGPVTLAERMGLTALLRRTASAAVPRGTRSAVVTMTAAAPLDTDGQIDSYADNLSLTLRASQLPGPTPPIGPPSFPAPKLGESVNVVPVTGRVYISTPLVRASARATAVPGLKGKVFVRLRAARQIPVGSLLDTRKGTVRLASARDAAGNFQVADFGSGVFQVLQSGKKSARGLTEARLKGASFKPCRARGKSSSVQAVVRARSSRRASRRRIRRLRGRTTGGRFKTGGRYSSATVRGTDWTVTDRCDGTLTSVKKGRVAVRDFKRRKNISVRAGKRYLARSGSAG